MNLRLLRVFPDTEDEPESPWVVLGHGQVTRGPGPHANRIEVAVAPLSGGEAAMRRPYDVKGVDLARLNVSRVPVSLLGLFRTGDIWYRERPAGALSFTRRTVKVRYGPKHFSFVEAGRTREAGGQRRWLLPQEVFPLGNIFPRAQLVAISDGKYPYRYLIPSLLMLCFYYGGSSELYRAVFKPGFGQPNNPAFDPAQTLIKGDELTLHLRPGIPLEDARIVAAWTTDYGLSQVARIYESSLVPRNGVEGFPRVLPPFTGREQLEVEGVLLAPGSRYQRFLVLRILSGSLPVPCKRIVVANPELAQPTPGQTKESTDEPPSGLPGAPRVKNSVALEPGALPAPGRRIGLEMPSSERFAEQPVIVRLRKPPSPPRSTGEKKPKTGSVPIEVVIPGAAGDVGEGTARKVVIHTPDTPPSEPTGIQGAGGRSPIFMELHDCLDALDAVLDRPHSIMMLPNLRPDDGDCCASIFPPRWRDKDAYHAWYYRQRSRVRRRKLLVATALYKGSWFALLEPEVKPHEEFQLAVVHSGVNPPDCTALANLAAAAAANHCIWPEGRRGGLDVRRQKHIWKNEAGFVKDITALFNVMTGMPT